MTLPDVRLISSRGQEQASKESDPQEFFALPQ